MMKPWLDARLRAFSMDRLQPQEAVHASRPAVNAGPNITPGGPQFDNYQAPPQSSSPHHARPIGNHTPQSPSPVWRQVHVDQDLDAHATGSETSRSSTRHAA